MTRVLCLTLLVGLVSQVSAPAQETKGKKKAAFAPPVFQEPKEIDLTTEQKEKWAKIREEHEPEWKKLSAAADSVLTADQKAARKSAQAQAKADNLKGKDAKAAIDKAVALTADQQSKWDAAQKELLAFQDKVRAKQAEVLTDEQKAKVPAFAPKKKKKAA
jgi:hypothetical protein